MQAAVLGEQHKDRERDAGAHQGDAYGQRERLHLPRLERERLHLPRLEQAALMYAH
ncbi:MAG TPA: hypothetical protein VKV80_13140 [Streptosporangiaceae bacterium]|nr:hypothetical protein [Streptosporangiaceae bacterium]